MTQRFTDGLLTNVNGRPDDQPVAAGMTSVLSSVPVETLSPDCCGRTGRAAKAAEMQAVGAAGRTYR
jgi:hypothetical protein